MTQILLSLQEGDKNFKRLTLTQPVGLRHAGFVISVDKVVKVRQLHGGPAAESCNSGMMLHRDDVPVTSTQICLVEIL